MEPNIMPPSKPLSPHFLAFYMELHEKYTPWQQRLAKKRLDSAELALTGTSGKGTKPTYLPDKMSSYDWNIELPEWCQDQRNQMTGPADNEELIVKMMNSGAPGVMVDFEDSTANTWNNICRAHNNALGTLWRTVEYTKKGTTVRVDPKSKAILWIRPRGLHMAQNLAFPASLSRITTSASLFDVVYIAFHVSKNALGLEDQPLCFYVPKSESAEEAKWWASLFKDIAAKKGWESDYIKCMALLESHPLAYQAEEFIYELRDHIVGLNLGRWDYMASLIEHNLADRNWLLPDRNAIPHDVAFFQDLRKHMVNICHSHGILAIGGMTALYPSRKDPELNTRALKILEEDKKNEAAMGMDGAWTGHPDQNQIAVDQFPVPNQIGRGHANPDTLEWDHRPDLRPSPPLKPITEDGTRKAIRVAIRYRAGVLMGRGASLLDGYMEDLATDRICRLMIAQRMKHLANHTTEFISRLFDEELALLDAEVENCTDEALRKARLLTEQYVTSGLHNPE